MGGGLPGKAGIHSLVSLNHRVEGFPRVGSKPPVRLGIGSMSLRNTNAESFPQPASFDITTILRYIQHTAVITYERYQKDEKGGQQLALQNTVCSNRRSRTAWRIYDVCDVTQFLIHQIISTLDFKVRIVLRRLQQLILLKRDLAHLRKALLQSTTQILSLLICSDYVLDLGILLTFPNGQGTDSRSSWAICLLQCCIQCILGHNA